MISASNWKGTFVLIIKVESEQDNYKPLVSKLNGLIKWINNIFKKYLFVSNLWANIQWYQIQK